MCQSPCTQFPLSFLFSHTHTQPYGQAAGHRATEREREINNSHALFHHSLPMFQTFHSFTSLHLSIFPGPRPPTSSSHASFSLHCHPSCNLSGQSFLKEKINIIFIDIIYSSSWFSIPECCYYAYNWMNEWVNERMNVHLCPVLMSLSRNVIDS